MNNFWRNLLLLGIVVLLLFVLFNLFQPSQTERGPGPLAYSEFLSDVNQGQVKDVTIQGHDVTGHLTNGSTFQTYTPDDPNMVQRLTDKQIEVTAKPEDADGNVFVRILFSWGPILAVIVFWIFVMRQMQSGGGRAMGFGKSRARMLKNKVA